jgi:hypothetical protein
VDEGVIKWAKCGAFSSEEEAWKFSWNRVFRFTQQITGFLFDEVYLKEVEAETDSDEEISSSLKCFAKLLKNFLEIILTRLHRLQKK